MAKVTFNSIILKINLTVDESCAKSVLNLSFAHKLLIQLEVTAYVMKVILGDCKYERISQFECLVMDFEPVHDLLV